MALASASPATESSLSTDETKAYSCVTCYNRKVKCDKKVPCSNCRKSASDCIYQAPQPPKRGKRKRLDDEDPITKCRRYEDLLRQAGIPLNCPVKGFVDFGPRANITAIGKKVVNTSDDEAKRKEHTGSDNLFTKPGTLLRLSGKGRSTRSRYLQSTLWSTVTEQFRDANDMLGESDDEDDAEDANLQNALQDAGLSSSTGADLLFGSPAPVDIYALYPSEQHVDLLCKNYQQNVDPLVKIVLATSIKKVIQQAQHDIFNLSKGRLACLFAVYLAAVNSMTNEECEEQLNDTRSNLLDQFQIATQATLVRAHFIASPELVTLKAFTLYLLAMRQRYDHPTLWALAGVAVRMAQRFGLHRDGTVLKLSPYETQSRRILWWQLVILDGRTGELAGASGGALAHHKWDTKLPLNYNDEDLSPDSTEWPPERKGITDISNVLLRLTMAEFRRTKMFMRNIDGNSDTFEPDDVVEERGKSIDMFEKQLEEDIMKYVQPQIPEHFLCSITVRAAMSIMRVLAHHPKYRPDGGANMTQAEKDAVFRSSLEVIETDLAMHSNSMLKRYLWHVKNYFQWPAFIYILSELRLRFEGDEVEKAWRVVAEVFELREEFSSTSREGLGRAIANLTLKAWTEREQYFVTKNNSGYTITRPAFITKMLSRRKRSTTTQSSIQINSEKETQSPAVTENSSSHEDGSLSAFLDVTTLPGYFDPDDWLEWDRLLQEAMAQPFTIPDVQPLNTSM